MTPHHPRENVRFVDLAAYRRLGHDEPVKYEGVDLLKMFTWSLAILLSLSVWAGLLLLGLYLRG